MVTNVRHVLEFWRHVPARLEKWDVRLARYEDLVDRLRAVLKDVTHFILLDTENMTHKAERLAYGSVHHDDKRAPTGTLKHPSRILLTVP